MYLTGYLTHTLLATMNLMEYLTPERLPYAVHAVSAPVISFTGLYGSYHWLQGRVIDSRIATEALYYAAAAVIVHVVYRVVGYGRRGVEARHMAALWIAGQAIQSGEAELLMPCLLGAMPYALRAYGLLTERGFRWLYGGFCVGWPTAVLLMSRMTAGGCAVLTLGIALAALEFTRII